MLLLTCPICPPSYLTLNYCLQVTALAKVAELILIPKPDPIIHTAVVTLCLPTPIDNSVVGELLTPVPDSVVAVQLEYSLTPVQRDCAVDCNSNCSTLLSDIEIQ